MGMNRNKRLRRVALLCCHFARNLAYYKGGWDGQKFKGRDEFWATVNSNFLDICVLEWSKLFGDHSDKHHWKKIVDDKIILKSTMFTKLGITQTDFDNCWESIKEYRDKFVAHLDSEEVMYIPVLDNIAWFAVIYYYNYVIKSCTNCYNMPVDLETYYNNCYSDAKNYYNKNC
jgi:hypothetical protein